MMDRRTFIAFAGAAALAGRDAAAGPPPRVTVAKSPSCGCCGAWADRMRTAGFEVEVRNMEQDALDALKRRLGLSRELSGCHTATVEGYFVEGHVPPEDVKRLLAERPDARGITVPGMPMGSPGMEYGDRKDPFDTILVGPDGELAVFERHR